MKNNIKVLVTGGNGFVGSHCIVQLLQAGYLVCTTIRSLQKKQDVINMVLEGGVKNLDNLRFAQADMLNDEGWDEAMQGCAYVLHVASPIFLHVPDDENDMIRPAVEGARRVLKAARNAGVKRVVMTSNFGAVGYSHQDKTTPITEQSWTNSEQKGLSAYNKSKVLAERAAWDFMAAEGGALELAVINPMGIFGPALSAVLSSGFGLLQQVIQGKMKALPNITLGIVDVRDVADLHIRAMTNPAAAGQRFLALAGGTMSLLQIAKILKEQMPQYTRHTSLKTMPDWVVRIAALFSKKAKAIAPLVGVYRNASNAKAKTVLGWSPRSNTEAVLASAQSMIKWGAIRAN